MNIVLRELRFNAKSIIIWSFSMFFLIMAGMLKYSGFESAGQSVNDLFDQLPPFVKAIFGMMGLDLTSIASFYVIFFLYFMLLAGVHAVLLGATIISKEERDKTADFLFVKPVLRSRVITAKLIATLINLVILNIVTLISSIFFVAKYNNGEPINALIIKLMVALFILQLIFASIGAAISGFTKSSKKASSIATAFLLTTFMLSVAIDLYDKISFLRFLTPFKYFKAVDFLLGQSFKPSYLLLSAVIVIGCTAFTYFSYNKRDLYI